MDEKDCIIDNALIDDSTIEVTPDEHFLARQSRITSTAENIENVLNLV